ncbi:MAG: TIGR02281 family clan AA aspartic protease [Pseudomonadota bacterium]
MIFWPVLLVGLMAIALLLAGPPSAEMLEPGHPGPRVYLTLLLTGLVVGTALRMLLYGGQRTLAFAGAWILCLGVLGAGFLYQGDLRWVASRIHGEFVPSMAVSSGSGEVELRRAWDGHYRADALINGQPIRLLVDTGASMVLIPYEDAARLGINLQALDFTMPVTTANGRSTVAPVRLERIEVGEIQVMRVNAAVARPGSLKAGLLGMSFLDHLSETSFQRDKLVLRQRQMGLSSGSRWLSAPTNTHSGN